MNFKQYFYESFEIQFKEEMKEYLKNQFKGLEDVNSDDFNFDMEIAIYWYAYGYHEGQDSDLYQILSTSPYNPGRSMSSVEDEGEMAKMLYDSLVDKYQVKTESVVNESKPARLGTVYPIKARIYNKDKKEIGFCIDTPNAIAKAFMEIPEAEYVKPFGEAMQPKDIYKDRMSDWNNAISGYYTKD